MFLVQNFDSFGSNQYDHGAYMINYLAKFLSDEIRILGDQLFQITFYLWDEIDIFFFN